MRSQKKQVSMVKIIKTPIRAISKALDLYVKGVTNFSTTYNRPLRTMEAATPDSHQLPRSLSTSILSDNDIPPEGALVRSISTAAIGGRATQLRVANLDVYRLQHQRQQLQPCASKKGVPRSCSVGMGRIEEDRVSSFRKEHIVVRNKLLIEDNDSTFSRSRTYNRMSTKPRQYLQ
ncbi:uncharacterized protein LOC112502895 [Cynara cardunculus var. scolymus]|uniref:uncharacterized protein LOC112502895 n=1 Tax=Cynara cardunculus var. scolymus TaxID=59895 RepID=UPI000D62C378|nr:uncharacterized protein LOC112502895 [Cynara cardunculus var. scolymus]